MANKPWLKSKEENVIEVMGAKITLKKMGFGESRKAISQAMQVDIDTKKANVDASLVGVLRCLYQIADWDLTDENDSKLPVSLETLDMLDEGFVGELMAEIQKRDNNSITEAEKK